MTGSTGLTILLRLEEEYQQVRLARPKPITRKKPQPKPDLPSISMTVRLEEEYYILEQDPLQIQEKVLTPEEQEEKERLETNRLISQLRQQHSLVCHQNNSHLSSKESRELEVCRECHIPTSGDYCLEVLHHGRVAFVEAVAGIALRISWDWDKKDWWYRCLYCEDVLEEEVLEGTWSRWWEDLKKQTKERAAMKTGQDHKRPEFKIWLWAYRETMKDPTKLPSSLDRLASSFDVLRQQ